MEALGVLQALKEHPVIHTLFIGGPAADPTAIQMKDLFRVVYAVEGSSRRLSEERGVGFFRDWLCDVEGMYQHLT